ncbi:MAG TPA: hypothetical protein VHO06_09820 [Polyangia bacterium]|nr:hypothetical protein [Polyangia bacterium]
MRRALAFLGGALLLLVHAGAGRAGDARARPAGRQVDLLIGATTAEADLLESSVRDMLAAKGLVAAAARKQAVTAQDLAAAIAPPKETTPSVARILVDLTVPGQATLFLIDPRRGRVHVRRMALAHGLDAVARAGVLFVVEQSIDAIIEGRDIGVSREEFQRRGLPAPMAEAPPPPTAVPSRPAAPPPPGPRWLLAGGYDLVALGSGEVQQGVKLWAGARFAALQVAVAARLAAPISVAGDGAGARLSTAGAGVSGAGRLSAFGRFSLAAGLGAGLDLVRVDPTVTAAGLQPAAPFWAASPWVQPFAALVCDAGRLSVSLVAGAELHPLAERYTVRSGGDASDVFVPWRLRPSAALLAGVAF